MLAVYYSSAGELFVLHVMTQSYFEHILCVSKGISFVVSIVAPAALNQLIGVVIVFSLTCIAGGMPTLASLDHKIVPLGYFYHAS